MENRKPIQLNFEQHNWFMSYKMKRGFKNSESTFDELRKLADEHFFDIKQTDRYEVKCNKTVGIYVHDTYTDSVINFNDVVKLLNGI